MKFAAVNEIMNCQFVKCIDNFVKLRRGSGKGRQGMAVKAKGLKA